MWSWEISNNDLIIKSIIGWSKKKQAQYWHKAYAKMGLRRRNYFTPIPSVLKGAHQGSIPVHLCRTSTLLSQCLDNPPAFHPFLDNFPHLYPELALKVNLIDDFPRTITKEKHINACFPWVVVNRLSNVVEGLNYLTIVLIWFVFN